MLLSTCLYCKGMQCHASDCDCLHPAAPLLQILRKQHKCKLPVEIAHLGPQELDAKTLAAFNKELGPVYGLDLTAVKYPAHHSK